MAYVDTRLEENNLVWRWEWGGGGGVSQDRVR